MKKLFLVFALVLSLIFVSCSQDDKISRESYDIMYAHLSQMWAQSLAHTDAETAFFGDSRVAGADWYSAYPEEKVINLGVGGDRIGNLITRLGQVKTLAGSGSLKRCFVAIGGNDCLSSKFNADKFKEEYDSLLAQLSELGITVYVNTIAGVTSEDTPVSANDAKKANSKIEQANAIIRASAQKYNVVCIEIAALMDNGDGSLKREYASADGVHFSEEGNQIWFDTLRPYVE